MCVIDTGDVWLAYCDVLIVQLDDLMVALESERSKLAALDKKQRKFDQSLGEEKAISER